MLVPSVLSTLVFVALNAANTPQPCPCTSCPCNGKAGSVLPRTCDVPSISAALPFCDSTKSNSVRINDLISRLTREEKINLVIMSDTGFLPRLNLKEFNFYNTCLHGWWTSNVTTFGMPAGMAATFDAKVMRQIGEVVGSEGRAISQREYETSFDFVTGYHGVAYNFLVCKDAAEVNMNRHPLWGRNPETYGEDPYLTATMGEAFTQQMQQPLGLEASKGYKRIAAVTRHLVVYSGPESLKADGTQGEDRFSFNANVSKRDLEAYFYPPFEACIDRNRGNSAGAMCSDAAQNGVPSCASRLLMEEKPHDWNASDSFFVVSDMDSYYNVFAQHHYAANTSDAVLTSLNAGLDILYLRGGPRCRGWGGATAMDCPNGAQQSAHVNATKDAFESATNGSAPDPRFTLADLDEKAGIALRIRFELGEFDPMSSNPYSAPVNASVIDSAAHWKIAREASAASVILLKNDDDLLPLSTSLKVAAIGPYINPSLQLSLSSPSANPYVHAYAGSSSKMEDFLQGLQSRLVTPPVFTQGCETNQTSKNDPGGKFLDAKAAAANADVVVLAVGLVGVHGVYDKDGVGSEQEMRDRPSLELPQIQLDLIKAVRSVAKKVVLVIVSGSAVPFDESLADAAVYAIYGGEAAGAALADVLFGDVSPSGRLPFTVFANLSQMKPMEDYELTTQPGRTHLYYDDSSVQKLGAPQFWFGYGLSYSTFTFSDLTLKLEKPSPSSCALMASVSVRNTGKTPAREVAQLYLSRPKSSNATAAAMMAPWPLRGFGRTDILPPGATATLHFALSFNDLSTVDEEGERAVTAGAYTVQVGGGNPRDAREGVAKAVSATVTLPSGCKVPRHPSHRE